MKNEKAVLRGSMCANSQVEKGVLLMIFQI
jgi:hypothetical protein